MNVNDIFLIAKQLDIVDLFLLNIKIGCYLTIKTWFICVMLFLIWFCFAFLFIFKLNKNDRKSPKKPESSNIHKR